MSNAFHEVVLQSSLVNQLQQLPALLDKLQRLADSTPAAELWVRLGAQHVELLHACCTAVRSLGLQISQLAAALADRQQSGGSSKGAAAAAAGTSAAHVALAAAEAVEVVAPAVAAPGADGTVTLLQEQLSLMLSNAQEALLRLQSCSHLCSAIQEAAAGAAGSPGPDSHSASGGTLQRRHSDAATAQGALSTLHTATTTSFHSHAAALQAAKQQQHHSAPLVYPGSRLAMLVGAGPLGDSVSSLLEEQQAPQRLRSSLELCSCSEGGSSPADSPTRRVVSSPLPGLLLDQEDMEMLAGAAGAGAQQAGYGAGAGELVLGSPRGVAAGEATAARLALELLEWSGLLQAQVTAVLETLVAERSKEADAAQQEAAAERSAPAAEQEIGPEQLDQRLSDLQAAAASLQRSGHSLDGPGDLTQLRQEVEQLQAAASEAAELQQQIQSLGSRLSDLGSVQQQHSSLLAQLQELQQVQRRNLQLAAEVAALQQAQAERQQLEQQLAELQALQQANQALRQQLLALADTQDEHAELQAQLAAAREVQRQVVELRLQLQLAGSTEVLLEELQVCWWRLLGVHRCCCVHGWTACACMTSSCWYCCWLLHVHAASKVTL
jgi:hypothetical protein